MSRTAKTTTAFAAGVMLTALLPATPAAAARAWSCPSGNVCFYTGINGSGSRCAWSVQDPDWTGGTMVCSWATRSNVKSVWNNGTDPDFSGVAYYLARNYERRVGCTRQGARGNLTGTYRVLSHRWVTGTCG